MTLAINLDDIKQARHRIKSKIHTTPVLTSTQLNNQTNKQIYLKCENFQKIGAFKIRGATNAVSVLQHQSPPATITHSSGNHGQALALASQQAGIPCHVVCPSNAPCVKKAAMKSYGATLHECIPTLEARESTCREIQNKTGAVFIHPYNHPDVMAGQGTLMLEFLEQVQDGLDCVIVPVGGGGMLSGCCVAAKGIDPSIRVFAAEPKNVDDCARSLSKGSLVESNPKTSVADGLLTLLGSNTWPVIKQHVERVFTVSESEIVAAMKFVWERIKIVIEPSAAVGVAVAMFNQEFRNLEGIQKVGIVISGGMLI